MASQTLPKVPEKSSVDQVEVSHLPSSLDGTVALPSLVYHRDGKADPEKSGASSAISSSDVDEKGNAWDGYEEDVLPEKTQSKWVRNVRHQVFSLYRRLFGIVFATNMAVLIATYVRGGADAQYLGQIVVANLFVSILMRQEYVINTFFLVFTSIPTWTPLWFRRICARVHHIGGIHSGCGVSGTIWLIVFTVQATKEVVRKQQTSIATLVVTYVILILLITMVILAYPKNRILHHNTFERTHRFFGWTIVALVWAQVILLVNDYKSPDQSLGDALKHAAPFWLTVVLTASIILPWVRLRHYNIKTEVLSEHAVRLYFDYVTPQPGQFIRVSDSPLFEWHSFAVVPVPGQTGYSAVISRAGDWTSKTIDGEPPSKIWIRGIPCCGALTVTKLFRRVVLVATGSGIGPIAPWIFAKKVPSRLLWTAPHLRKTFGDKLVDSVLEAAPDAVIYDTRIHGRPDMVKLIYRLVRESNAEAVCIISNQPLTEKVVYGMMSRGIPAFGAIWDS